MDGFWIWPLLAAIVLACFFFLHKIFQLQTQINEDEETQDDFTAAIGRAHIRKEME